jgi:hypothetical protein
MGESANQPAPSPHPPVRLSHGDFMRLWVLVFVLGFFNLNMPKYSNLDTMRAKIKMALLCSTITS